MAHYRFSTREKWLMGFWPFQVWRWFLLTLQFLKLTKLG